MCNNIFVLDLLRAPLEPFPWISPGFTAPGQEKILLEARCHTYFGVHLRPLTILNKSETFKTLSYVLFMCEKSSAVVVALLLNFLPSDTSGPSQKNSAMKLGLYKAALFVYALEGYTMAILGSTIAVYKVLTVPNTADTNDAPDIQAVVSLMLLITNNALRYYLAEFFFSKLFDQDVDILGGGTKNISESLAQPATVDQAQESYEASCQMSAPLWMQGETSRTRRSAFRLYFYYPQAFSLILLCK